MSETDIDTYNKFHSRFYRKKALTAATFNKSHGTNLADIDPHALLAFNAARKRFRGWVDIRAFMPSGPKNDGKDSRREEADEIRRRQEADENRRRQQADQNHQKQQAFDRRRMLKTTARAREDPISEGAVSFVVSNKVGNRPRCANPKKSVPQKPKLPESKLQACACPLPCGGACAMEAPAAPSVDALLGTMEAPVVKVLSKVTFKQALFQFATNETNITTTKDAIQSLAFVQKAPPLGFDLSNRVMVRAFIHSTAFIKQQLHAENIEFLDGRVADGAELRGTVENFENVDPKLSGTLVLQLKS